jgi:acyl-CoA synthetase (AMP-forming)/AMP-acid ligase II
MGALFAGALPVAMARGAAMGAGEAHQVKVEGVVERLGAKYAVVSDGFRTEAKRSGLAPHTVEVAITAEELAGLTPQTVQVAAPDPSDIAFLQLTSGSTGVPRAVRIPHRAALHNSHANDLAIGHPHGAPTHQWADSMVSWLPLNHDMGLVGCLLLSIYCGFDLWLFEPSSFLARPRNWLEHIGSHGTAFTPAPNFGYQLCLERMTPEQRKGLDLSNWHDAMTGAEMIRPETVADFCEAFGPYGFRPEAFRPCYGLAEGTLAVTFDHKACGVRTRPLPKSATTGMGLDEVVCVGHPVVDTEVQITSPSGHPLPEGEIGDVRAMGPSIFAGYYNDPESTAESLVDGWLITGDLGFLHRGELYITGRVKDLIIVRGHNLMPHEIEWVAEGVTGGGGALRSGAFAVSRGAQGEEAVLVVEAESRDRDKLSEIGDEIRSRIGRTLSLPLADLVFVRRGRIPKTTSGKVQRRQLRELYLRGEIERL